jgi:hypothetical protein
MRRNAESAAAEPGGGTRSDGPVVVPRPGTLGDGRPLELGVASRMGAAFGHSFARVRVFDGPAAADFAARERAVAVTVGNDIALAPSAPRPGSAIGDALLAHELAHVKQQDGGELSAASRATESSTDEAEARDATVAAMLHMRGVREVRPQVSRRGGVAVRRCGGVPSWAPAMPQGSLTPSSAGMINGAAADRILSSSPSLGSFLRPRIEGTLQRCGGSPPARRAEGHVQFFQGGTQWNDAVLNYLSTRANPDVSRCDKTYTEPEARAHAPRVAGFADQDTLRLDETSTISSDVIHEVLHFHQHDSYSSTLGWHTKEGTTQFFAETISNEQSPALPVRAVYVDETNAIRTAVQRGGISINAFAQAYFDGNFDALRTAMDNGHPGRYDQWRGFMNRITPDYAAANALF